MDYDDNDFQSQNFHLGGEDNKFPQCLRSYALPKFDLDEHLHLRFDSLVETEALLGIQSPEESHWIEDFSRGTSGIEFGSSAAESCSISMRNNVWSEATSSESVEMLLKSVRQDEITKQTNEDSGTCEALNSLDNQMDLSLNRHDSPPSQEGEAIDANPTLPPDKGLKSSSGLCKDAAADLPVVEEIQEICQDKNTGFESLTDLSASCINEKYEPYVNVDAEQCNIDQKITLSSMDMSATDVLCSAACGVTGENLYNNAVECMDVDPLAMPIKDSVTAVGNLNDQQISQDEMVSCAEAVLTDKSGGLLKDNAEKGETEVFNKDVSMDCQHCDGNLVDDGKDHVMGDISMNKLGANEDIPSKNQSALLNADSHLMDSGNFSKDKETGDDNIGNTNEKSLVLMEERQNVELELSESRNNNVANLSNSTANIPSATDKIHDAEETEQIEDGHIVGTHPMGDSEFAVTVKKREVDVTGNNSFNSDVHLTESQYVIEEHTRLCDSLDVSSSGGKLCALSSVHDKLSKPSASSSLGVGSNDTHSLCSVVPIVNKENMGLPTTSVHSEVQIGGSLLMEKMVETSSSGESTATVTADAHGSCCGETIGDGPISTKVVVADVVKLASINKLEENNQVTSEIVEHKVGRSTLSTSDVIVSDRKEEWVTGVSTEPTVSVQEGNCNSHISSKPISTSNSGQCLVCKTKELLPQMDSHSSDSVEKSVLSLCENESQTFDVTMATTESDKGLEGHCVAHGSGIKEVDACEALSPCKEDKASAFNITGETLNCHKETTFRPLTSPESIVESCPAEAVSGNPLSDEPNCGSPTTISCSESSQSAKECQADGNDVPLQQNSSISEDQPHAPFNIQTVANDAKSALHHPKENDVSDDDKSFTFKVGSLEDVSGKETDKGWKLFSNIQPFELSQTVKSSVRSGLGNSDLKIEQGASRGSNLVSDVQKIHVGTKVVNDNKSMSVSGSAPDKRTTMQDKGTRKSLHNKKTKEKDGSPFSASGNLVGTISRALPVEELRQYMYIEGNSTKLPSASTTQSSNLPDLNSSASVTIFHQPFTDAQQVQLRAQIFVYGSLIQGAPPDESCMISAFGDASHDGGRSLWENVWRLAVERYQSQRSPLSNPETPLTSRSGTWGPEQVPRCSPLWNKTHGTAVGRTGITGAPPAILSPMMSLSTPVWRISTPSHDGLQSSSIPGVPFLDSHQSPSPLHPYHSPHMRQFVGSSSTLLPNAPCAVPWVISPQTAATNASVQFPVLPIAEAGQVASIQDSSMSLASNMQLSPSSPLIAAGDSVSVPAGTTLLTDAKRVATSSRRRTSVDQKSRKKKRNATSEEIGQISSVSPHPTEPVTLPPKDLSSAITTSVGMLSPAHSVPRDTSSIIFSTSSPISVPMRYHEIGGGDVNQNVVFSGETCNRIEQAKLQAEDAAAVAASAVRYSQGIWSQLAIQKNSGLISEIEAKLASAAVAASAAASVAKAAAAAAKVASDAALQAKLMADVSLSIPKVSNSVQSSENVQSDGEKSFGRISPASILHGNDRINSSNSVIVAAREAARKRVEAASAAAKQAENLDAVFKAAELAAEAVSQAGIIIAMGDALPLSLSRLAEAGLEGFLRLQKVPSEQLKLKTISGGEHSNLDGVDGSFTKHLNVQSTNTNGMQKKLGEENMPSKEVASVPAQNYGGLVNVMHLDSANSEKGLAGQNGCKTVGIIPESEDGSASLAALNDEYEKHQLVGTSNDNSIVEGSVVEVVSDEGLGGVWFSAKVLSLRDGKAYVCYEDLLDDQGLEKLKEWIPLEGKGGNAPRIRIAHPMTLMKFEGTRKRRREALGNHVWSVGDRVDAWMRDRWREGIVMEKYKEDETKLTVRFTAGGDVSVVRPWNMKPSVVWKDGQWMECSRDIHRTQHEGDTPQDKRQKLIRPEVDLPFDTAGGKSKLSKVPCSENSLKPEDSRSLMLSEKEKTFSIGKDSAQNNNSNAFEMKRTGLQKEGSRVVFGVPKPGKKRKFMDVSKHCVVDRAPKVSEGTDSIKFAKYLMPQGSRGSKITSRVDLKGKPSADSKPKALKSVRSQGLHINKSMPEKDNSSISVVFTPSDGVGQVPLTNLKTSVLHHRENKQNHLEAGSFSNSHKANQGPILFSSLGLASDITSSKKKPSSAVGAELGTKRKHALAGDKFARLEEKSSDDNSGRENPDAIEPRRSNRRIQPTSRLLEGLQSSLILSKIPPVSHVKGVKTQHRSVTSSRGNNHGR